jgi:hypothetical protein
MFFLVTIKVSGDSCAYACEAVDKQAALIDAIQVTGRYADKFGKDNVELVSVEADYEKK